MGRTEIIKVKKKKIKRKKKKNELKKSKVATIGRDLHLSQQQDIRVVNYYSRYCVPICVPLIKASVTLIAYLVHTESPGNSQWHS